MSNFKKSSKSNTGNTENIDLRDNKQREKFMKKLRKELKAYDNNYENIIERRKALEKIEAEQQRRDEKSWEVFEELEDCKF